MIILGPLGLCGRSRAFSRPGSRLLIAVASLVAEHRLQKTGSPLRGMDLAAPPHVGSSRSRDCTGVPCTATWSLNRWTTREAPSGGSECDRLCFKSVQCLSFLCFQRQSLGLSASLSLLVFLCLCLFSLSTLCVCHYVPRITESRARQTWIFMLLVHLKFAILTYL